MEGIVILFIAVREVMVGMALTAGGQDRLGSSAGNGGWVKIGICSGSSLDS